MKNSYLRAGAALACALALSACGGDDGELLLGGYMSGVTKTGLVLTNNGGSDYAVPVPASGSGTFNFPELISTDDRYNVEVKSSPSNVIDSGCTVEYGSGRAGYHVSSIIVTCELKRHALTGTISNLQGTLVLVNGSDRKEFPAGSTSFKMDVVPEDSPYGISVLTQPTGQTCTVSNGAGTMGSNDINNVAVTCTP